MQQYLAGISLVVNDYDEAIDFYTRKLSFTLLEDTRMSDTKRWVVIAPPGSTGCTLLLAKAANDAQKAAVGNQTGGRVFLFLHTNNFDRDYKQMQEAGIEFMESPPAGSVWEGGGICRFVWQSMGFDRTQKNTLKQLYVQKIIAIIRMVTGKHIGVVDSIGHCFLPERPVARRSI